ncbi:MAG: site-specific integrase [bacterium]|nr:site-specific integrase [bacterium]
MTRHTAKTRARHSAKRITTKTVEQAKKLQNKLPPGGDAYIWAADLPGFALRVRASARDIPYVIDVKHKKIQHKMVIGYVSSMDPEQAYEIVRPKICRIKLGQGLGEDKPEITVSQLADEYMDDCVAHNKPSTMRVKRSRIKRHIKPKLGKRLARSITRDDIKTLHRSMVGTPCQANDTLRLLRAMFNWAEDEGYREPRTNPCKSIRLYPENNRDRHLTEEELPRLAWALQHLEYAHPFEVSALRLLLFTGARKDEIVSLRWEEVHLYDDIPHLELEDSKTKKSYRALNQQAAAQLYHLRDLGKNRYGAHDYVFPSPKKPGRPLSKIERVWYKVRDLAGIKNFRMHDLRHTYASLAVGEDVELFAVGKLLGHTDTATTTIYSHLPTKAAKRHADKVGNAIARHVQGSSSPRC